jgi:phosphotransferase system HPr (HPr) family protein
MFVKVANKHRADIWVQIDGQRVNGKSILSLMTLAAGRGTRVVISAEGTDAEKAVQELEILIQRRGCVGVEGTSGPRTAAAGGVVLIHEMFSPSFRS